MALTEFDRSLLKRCLAEDPGAWKDFVDRFIGLFIHVVNHTAHARSVKLQRDDVDDLCADVFLALLADKYAILRSFQGKSSLATYLTVISRRIVVREMSRRRMAEALGHVNVHQTSLEQAAAEVVDIHPIEDREVVDDLLKHLSIQDGDVVRAFHLDGKSYREISQELSIPENSVGSILSRARDKLRQRDVLS